MAEQTGFQGLLSDALSNPLISLGAGLLSAPRGATFGQALGGGVQFATGLQGQRTRNDLLREGLRDRQARRAALERRQAANQKLIELFAPADQASPSQSLPGTADSSTNMPTNLLEGVPGIPGGQGGAADSGQPSGISQRQFLGLLAEVAPEQFAQGLLSQVFAPPQKPGSLERDFAFLESLGLSQEEALDRLKKGDTFNIGTNDKPLGPSDLLRIRLPDGTTPPLGSTPSQIAAAGGRLVTPDQQKALDAAGSLGPVLDRIEELAIGEGGIFTDVAPGLGSRANAALDIFVGSIEGENPNVTEYNALVEGTLAPIIKFLGESGSLSESDRASAAALLPKIRDEFLLPDTREAATRKLVNLREILERAARNLERGIDVRTQSETEEQEGNEGQNRQFRFDPKTGGLMPR